MWTRMQWTRSSYAVSISFIGLSLAACQSTVPESPSELEALRNATLAYQAYERGDCETALLISDPAELANWEPSEVRYSTLLIHAYCDELAGDADDARAIYDDLVEEVPDSFAARDAKERSRILRIQESDPTHAAWMRDARDRAKSAQTSTQRLPVERRPAIFPPVARTSGIEGYVVIEFGVTPRGRTSDPIVIDSHPPLLFDGSAMRAIRRWEYARDASTRDNDIQVIRLLFRAEAVSGDETTVQENVESSDRDHNEAGEDRSDEADAPTL